MQFLDNLLTVWLSMFGEGHKHFLTGNLEILMQGFTNTELEDELIWRQYQNPEELDIIGKRDLCFMKKKKGFNWIACDSDPKSSNNMNYWYIIVKGGKNNNTFLFPQKIALGKIKF